MAKRLGEYATAHDNVICGGLHIVIEDGNVQTHHIEWCQSTQVLNDWERRFAADLLQLSLPERHAVIDMAWDNLHPWEYEDEAGDTARAKIDGLDQ